MMDATRRILCGTWETEEFDEDDNGRDEVPDALVPLGGEMTAVSSLSSIFSLFFEEDGLVDLNIANGDRAWAVVRKGEVAVGRSG